MSSEAERDLDRLRSQLGALRAQRASSGAVNPISSAENASKAFSQGEPVVIADDVSLLRQFKSASKLAYLGVPGNVVCFNAATDSYVVAFADGAEVEFPASAVAQAGAVEGSAPADDKENASQAAVAAKPAVAIAAAACPFPSRPAPRWKAPPPPRDVVQLAVEIGAAGGRAPEQQELAAALAAAGLPGAATAAAVPAAAVIVSARPLSGAPASVAPRKTIATSAKCIVAAPAVAVAGKKVAAPAPVSKAQATSSLVAAAAAAANGVAAVGGGAKAIRVVANGEYAASRFEADALPAHRVVVVKPIFKTMLAFKTAIARDLAWSSSGRKCAALYDAATGREVVSVDDLVDGMWYIASAGNPLQPIPTGSKFFLAVLSQMKVC